MEKIFLLVLENSIRISILFIMFYLFCNAIKSSFMNKYKYYVMIVLLIAFIIPFKIGTNIIDITLYDKQNVFIEGLNNNISLNTYKLSNNVNVISMFAAIWILGMIVYLLYNCISYFKMKSMINRWKSPISDNEKLNIFNEEKNKLGIRANISFYQSRFLDSPIMEGFLKMAVVIPSIDYSNDELRLILRHELVHFKRKDRYCNFILLIANAVNWFNPVVTFMNKCFLEECEISCDYEVLRNESMCNKKLYGKLLYKHIDKSNFKIGLACNFLGIKSVNGKRILSIIDENKSKKGLGLVISMIILVVITGSIISIPKVVKVPSENYINLCDEDGNEVTLKIMQN